MKTHFFKKNIARITLALSLALGFSLTASANLTQQVIGDANAGTTYFKCSLNQICTVNGGQSFNPGSPSFPAAYSGNFIGSQPHDSYANASVTSAYPSVSIPGAGSKTIHCAALYPADSSPKNLMLNFSWFQILATDNIYWPQDWPGYDQFQFQPVYAAGSSWSVTGSPNCTPGNNCQANQTERNKPGSFVSYINNGSSPIYVICSAT